jgi:transposase
MVKPRKQYTPEEEISILRQQLVEKVQVFDLCQELKFQPTVFYGWLKEFFENGAAAFQKESSDFFISSGDNCGRSILTVSLLNFAVSGTGGFQLAE